MKTCQCAVCGEVKTMDRFGNGVTCPKTTCLACKAKTIKFVEVKTVMFVERVVRVVMK